MAAIKALFFALELSLSSIILKGDFEMVIKSFKSEEESFASFGHLMRNLAVAKAIHFAQELGFFSIIFLREIQRL